MALEISISLTWAIIAFCGWLFFIILLVLYIFIMVKTPAWTFFIANLSGKPIIRAITPTGSGTFRRVKKIDAGCGDIPEGTFKLMENSYTRDTKSKVPIFDAFTTHGTTVNKQFAAIVEELRLKGFVINNFKQYEQLVGIASNKEDGDKYINSFTKEEEKERAIKLVETLRDPKFRIDIKTFKSYRMHELSNMFPFNLSPTFIREKAIAYNQRVVAKMGQKKDWMVLGVVAMIVIIGAALAYKFISGGDCNCVCQAARVGVEKVAEKVAENPIIM